VSPAATRAVRALLLLVTALGLALGVATTTVYDRPAGATVIEVECVNALVVTAEVVATATDAVGVSSASGALALGMIAAAVGICFAVVLGRMRLAGLLRRLRPRPAEPTGGAVRGSGTSRPGAEPLFDSLAVIRI